MSRAVLVFTDDLDVPLAGAEHDFGTVAPGATPTLTIWRLQNDLVLAGGIDPSHNTQVLIQARIAGNTTWETKGLELLESRAFRVRLIAENGVTVAGAFMNLGTGIQFPLVDLEPQTYHEFEVEPIPPAGASQIVTEFRLIAVDQATSTIGDPYAVPRGQFRGVGRGQVTGVIDHGGTISATGTDTLEVPDYSGVFLGLPYSELANDKVQDNTDSAAAALIAGESYLFYLLATAGGLAILKGLKGTPRTFPDDAPVIPNGEVAFGWGQRFADADALSMTFTLLAGAERDFLYPRVVSGLNVSIGNTAGPVVVEGSRIDTTTENPLTLIDDAVNTLWQLRGGTFAITLDGSSPQPGALEFFEMTTAGGVVTAQRDLRKWAGTKMLTFTRESPTGTESKAITNGTTRSWWIRPDQVSGYLEVDPQSLSGGPPVSGLLAGDFLIQKDGQAEASIFASQGSDDRRIKWVFGDTNQRTVGLPETAGLEIPPDAVLIFRTTDQPGGGGTPDPLTPGITPAWVAATIVVDVG